MRSRGWIPNLLFVYSRINNKNKKMKVMFKIKGNQEVEMLLNSNNEKVGEDIYLEWRREVEMGGIVGLQEFCEENDYDNYEFIKGRDVRIALDDYEYEVEWKEVYKAAVLFATGEVIEDHWIK
jgi:hypothetical protein